MAEKEQVDAYLNTIGRLEPEIAMIDLGAGIASIAISLKRIADSLERIAPGRTMPTTGTPTFGRKVS